MRISSTVMAFAMALPVAVSGSVAASSSAIAQEVIWTEVVSAHSVPDTVAKLEAIIEAAPPTLMAKIDHGANAAKAGLELAPSVLLIFGAPPVGTPIMQGNPLAGLDLPVKMLVFERDGKTVIAYTNPEALKQRYAVDTADPQFEQMGKVLAGFAEAASR